MLRLKFEKTTVLLPLSPSSTLSTLRSSLLSALTQGGAGEESLTSLPKSTSDIALWRLAHPRNGAEEGLEDQEKWVRLEDERSEGERLGLEEAAEVGVSFRTPDGKFPEPNVIQPIDDEEDEGEAELEG